MKDGVEKGEKRRMVGRWSKPSLGWNKILVSLMRSIMEVWHHNYWGQEWLGVGEDLVPIEVELDAHSRNVWYHMSVNNSRRAPRALGGVEIALWHHVMLEWVGSKGVNAPTTTVGHITWVSVARGTQYLGFLSIVWWEKSHEKKKLITKYWKNWIQTYTKFGLISRIYDKI